MSDSIRAFEKEYRWLSNFYPSRIVYQGIEYKTVEHAYQAAKTLSMIEKVNIAFAVTAGEAKKMGSEVLLRPDWEMVKLSIMQELLALKFAIPSYAEKLIATGDAELVEGNYWHDNFYGCCSCKNCWGTGQNYLGKSLMALREYLQK